MPTIHPEYELSGSGERAADSRDYKSLELTHLERYARCPVVCVLRGLPSQQSQCPRQYD